MRQRTVVWLIYHQSECPEEVIFVHFPCASEIVSRQGVSVDPPERVALARHVIFIYATPHNSWETLELGCPSNSLTLRTLYISCNHYFHIDYNAPCFPPQNFAQPLFPNSPGYHSRPKRNRKQWLCKVFFFWGGGVNKVHYGLCENGEYFACSWTSHILVDLCRTVTTVERPGTR